MMHNPSATRKMKNANDALMHCCVVCLTASLPIIII